MLREINFLDVDFSIGASIGELLEKLIEEVNHLHFAAVSTVHESFANAKLRDILNSGITISDSTPLNFFLKRIDPEANAIRGSDFFRFVLNDNVHAFRHFVIGSTKENFKEFEKIAKSLNPDILLVGHYSPDFDVIFEISQDLKECIEFSNPDLIWVCLGSPKQDYAAASISEEFQISTICVGAAIDFITGRVREAPIFLQYSGLEWFFRLMVEPKRLWRRYLFGNLVFLKNALKAQMKAYRNFSE